MLWYTQFLTNLIFHTHSEIKSRVCEITFYCQTNSLVKKGQFCILEQQTQSIIHFLWNSSSNALPAERSLMFISQSCTSPHRNGNLFKFQSFHFLFQQFANYLQNQCSSSILRLVKPNWANWARLSTASFKQSQDSMSKNTLRFRVCI